MEKAKAFYELIGITFQTEKHGDGPAHLAATIENCVFEIYPNNEINALDQTRIGFSVSDVHKMVEKITEAGYEVLTPPKKSKWGIRAVVKDPDGRSIELLEN